MTYQEIIDTLRMENDLYLFEPTTGETKRPEDLNELNRECYEAHKEAIKILEKLADTRIVTNMDYIKYCLKEMEYNHDLYKQDPDDYNGIPYEDEYGASIVDWIACTDRPNCMNVRGEVASWEFKDNCRACKAKWLFEEVDK